MDSNMIYILFLCVFPPLFMSLFILDKKARLHVFFILVGFFICFMVSGINGLLLNFFNNDSFYVTTTITPITEEIFKAIPILIVAFFFDSDRKKLIGLGFLIGIGFAVMENLVILTENFSTVNLFWATLRGFASASLHGVCTALIAFGISFVSQTRKMFLIGTFALLTTAITIHGIYNLLVQSDLAWIGYILPLSIYFQLIAYDYKQNHKKLSAGESHTK